MNIIDFEADRKRQIETFLPAATEMARKAGAISISLIQRQLGVGYTPAAALVDEMQRRGLVTKTFDNDAGGFRWLGEPK